MINFAKLLQITLASFLLPFTNSLQASQFVAASQTIPVIEVVRTYCLAVCESVTTRIYVNGRELIEGETNERSKSGRSRKVLFREEKQLEAEELADLVNLAEQPDFQNAQPEYVMKIVTDSPHWIAITYRHQGGEKIVKIYNFDSNSESERGKLPPALLKLLAAEGIRL
jgi:hypothetical protein